MPMMMMVVVVMMMMMMMMMMMVGFIALTHWSLGQKNTWVA
jgi:hypothetical protein